MRKNIYKVVVDLLSMLALLIHTLDTGDTITLTTQLGTRTYSVTGVMKVGETDNSMLAPTNDNCITLFTCVLDERDYRWCVRAVEV